MGPWKNFRFFHSPAGMMNQYSDHQGFASNLILKN